MPLPPRLDKEINELRETWTLEVSEEPDTINIIFKHFPIAYGYSLSACDLLVRVPRSYPDAGPDMFWTVPELTLQGGSIPQAAGEIVNYLGRPWRRFSWHGPPWNSTHQNMHSFVEFIRRRLREKK